jgi:molybdopterin adenylyltransferase
LPNRKKKKKNDMMFRAGIITVSDRGSQGLREDTSGPAIAAMLLGASIEVCCTLIIPDEIDQIGRAIINYADGEKLDLILTTGGTGVSPRDVTADATLKVIDKNIPGMAEAMRFASSKITPHAMLSRAVAGIRGHSLIINLPGSPKGAKENLAVILPALKHAIEKINGDDRDCAIPG